MEKIRQLLLVVDEDAPELNKSFLEAIDDRPGGSTEGILTRRKLRLLNSLSDDEFESFQTRVWKRVGVRYLRMVHRLLKTLTEKNHTANTFLTNTAAQELVTDRYFELTLFPDWSVNSLYAEIKATTEEFTQTTFEVITKPNAVSFEASFSDLESSCAKILKLVDTGSQTLKVTAPNLLWISLVSYVQLLAKNSGLLQTGWNRTKKLQFNTVDGKLVKIFELFL